MSATQKTKDKLIRLAAEAIGEYAPFQDQIETMAVNPQPGIDFQPDCLVKLSVNGKELKYYAEIKVPISKSEKLLFLLNQMEFPYPLLLITRYVNSELAEELRKNGIEFIDTAGNVFINQPPVYIFIKGNKPRETVRSPVKRTFKAAGLKMIFNFLCNPGLERKTYREIASISGVALGTVGWILKELEELGFLIKMGKHGLKLTRREMLLNRWVAAFPEQLRPKQMIGRYEGDHEELLRKKLPDFGAQWGGEVAAEKLTHYLKPQQITIYMENQHLNRLLLDSRLKSDKTGGIEILEKFWKSTGEDQSEEMVHPLLVYAELIATGNQRNIEVAKMIYEQHVVRFIRED